MWVAEAGTLETVFRIKEPSSRVLGMTKKNVGFYSSFWVALPSLNT